MKFIRPFFLLISGLLLIFIFQNCGSGSPFTVSNLRASSSLSGNGGGYEGKLNGVFYHYTPSYTCEGNAAADQITEVKNGLAYLYENKLNQCAIQSSPVLFTDMNVSPFQSEFLSIKDTLFKRYEVKPVGIPNSLAEVLCRDDFENPSFEIVSHYDRDSNLALTRIYFADHLQPDFPISRILSSDKVIYASDQIKFVVNFSTPIVDNSKKFAGQIIASKIIGVPEGKLACVVGGTLDTSKWNLRQLTTQDAGPFYLLGNGEVMFFSEISRNYFSSQFFTTVTHLFKIALDNSVMDFSKAILDDNYNVIYRIRANDKDHTMFAAKSDSEMWPSLFSYDFKTATTKKLTNLVAGASPEAYSSQEAVLTNDGHLFYDTRILGFQQRPDSVVLRVFDKISDTISDVHVITDSAGYKILPQTNRALILWPIKDGVSNVLEIYDAKTKTSVDYPFGSTGCLFALHSAEFIENESNMIATEYCANTKTNVVQINLQNGLRKVLGENKKIEWISTNKQWLMTVDMDLKRVAYNILSGVSIIVPIDPHLKTPSGTSSQVDLDNFSQSGYGLKVALANDTHLYGFGANPESPTLFHVNLANATSSAICEEAAGKKMFLGALNNQKVFLFTYEAAVKVYYFYLIKNSNECVRINEFPSDYPAVPKLISTNIGFGLLLGYPLSASTNNHTREAVFVPIDGRPPLKFNSNENSNWDMEVSEDRNRIVLRGPGSDGVLKIFSFNLLGDR